MILLGWSEVRCREGVALAGVAGIDPALEPAHAMRGAAVGERLRHDTAHGLPLEAVVADRGGGVQAFLDVAGFEDLARALGIGGPDARQAVGLQLHAHLERVALGLAATALRLLDALGDAEQVLHVMADLVGDDVGLGEIARGADLVAQVAVERQIDVELVIARTVEGAHCRLGEAAGRLHGAAEQHEARLLVSPAHLTEEIAPGVLRVGEDDRDEVAQLIVAGRSLLHARRGPGAPRVGPLEDHARVDAEVHGDQDEQQGADAAPDGGSTADRHATAILDVVTASAHLPSHRWPPASPPERSGRAAVVALVARRDESVRVASGSRKGAMRCRAGGVVPPFGATRRFHPHGRRRADHRYRQEAEAAGAAGVDEPQPTDIAERDHLAAVLRLSSGNLTRTAARLGIPRNTLRYRLEKLGLLAKKKNKSDP